MKKIILSSLFFLNIIISERVYSKNPPDEGMWLPMLVERLNFVDMQKAGLKLTAEELYSINKSSLKDAIVQFGGGCTGEIISKEGLLLTNHHCGYDAIQKHSNVQNDYLTDGFWAYSKTEELPCEGLSVTFLIRMDDVTQTVLKDITADMTESKRKSKIKNAIKKLEKEYSEDGKYEANIVSFFEGNEYYIFVYEVFKDVRLVGTPPSAIGKFGGDTDNWMWPRHTGDFSMFRVYTDANGAPAEYSKDNIPLKPKHHLPINIKGVKKNDFTMIWGYPGQTDRYLSSFGVKELLDIKAPTIINIRDIKLKIMKQDMDADDATRIQYASKYAQTANYWKYFIGQSKGLKRLKVIEKKQQIEKEFQEWINADAKRKEIYGNVISDLEEGAKNSIENLLSKRSSIFEEVFTGAEALYFVYKLNTLPAVLKNQNAKSSDYEQFRNTAKEHFKDYNTETDKKIFASVIEFYFKEIPEKYHPSIFSELNTKFKGDFKKMAEEVYNTSVVVSYEKFSKFIDKPDFKIWENDYIVKISQSMLINYISFVGELEDEKINRAKRLFIAGLREMKKDKKFYPDANFTLRMTYGKVLDYEPTDGVFYDFLTTERGIIEKEDPNNDEFIVPNKLKELIISKNFGRYQQNGKLPVCFLTNTDITGGNSGSPVLNGEGHLIGCAFDGNWEAMSGDIAFEPSMQRTICVDARYILFIIDKYANAQNLINEMTIIE